MIEISLEKKNRISLEFNFANIYSLEVLEMLGNQLLEKDLPETLSIDSCNQDIFSRYTPNCCSNFCLEFGKSHEVIVWAITLIVC